MLMDESWEHYTQRNKSVTKGEATSYPLPPCSLEQRWAEGRQEVAVGRGHTYLGNKREWKQRSRKKRNGEEKRLIENR